MLLDLFTYFAKFPQNSGVIKGIATKGESSMEEYATTLDILGKMEEKELVPEIQNYVYGQSFDELKQRIDKLTGSFLFVDYGEVDIHRLVELGHIVALYQLKREIDHRDSHGDEYGGEIYLRTLRQLTQGIDCHESRDKLDDYKFVLIFHRDGTYKCHCGVGDEGRS